MQGVKFQFNEEEQHLTVSVDVSQITKPLDTEQLVSLFLTTPHQHYYPLVDELGEFIDNINANLQEGKAEQHTTRFAIVKDAQLTITVADDKMSARLEILAPYAASIHTYSVINTATPWDNDTGTFNC